MSELSSELLHLEHTQPIPERYITAGYEVELAQHIDAIGHTVCELDGSDLKYLLKLASAEYSALLSERRGYVMARKGDLTRFADLLKLLDTRIAANCVLSTKMAKLLAVKS